MQRLSHYLKLLRRQFVYPFLIFLALLTAGVAAAWQGPPPTGTPPTNCYTGYTGCDQPLNQSGTLQFKQGGLSIANGAGITTGLTIINGSVGIGTASPSGKLMLEGSSYSDSKLRFSNTSETSNIGQWDIGIRVPTVSSDYLSFERNGTNILTLSINGAVGINNTSPVYKLDVGGDINVPVGNCVRYGGNCINLGGASGVSSITAGSGISVNQSTGAVTISNTGIVGGGTTGNIPRYTGGTTLGNSTLVSDGVSSAAVGNFFVTGTLSGNGGGALSTASLSVNGGTDFSGVSLDVNGAIHTNSSISADSSISANGSPVCQQNGGNCPTPATIGAQPAGTYCQQNGTNCPAGAQGYRFGGMYSTMNDSCAPGEGTANPLTGGCSCPTGTTPHLGGSTINAVQLNNGATKVFKQYFCSN